MTAVSFVLMISLKRHPALYIVFLLLANDYCKLCLNELTKTPSFTVSSISAVNDELNETPSCIVSRISPAGKGLL